MKQLKPLAAAITGLMLLGGSAAAYAIDTEVQFSTTGSGTGFDGSYDVLNINEFDWQSSGDLGIKSAITVTSGATTSVTTLAAYFGGGAALVGDVVVFDINSQARLNDMLDPFGNSVAPLSLDTNGATGIPALGDFEITAVLSGSETATVINTIGATVLLFTGITGTTTWYYDATPDSVVETGAGFADGIAILTADLVSAFGTFVAGVGGSSLIGLEVTSYNKDYLQTDPDGNSPLTGATFDTLISLVSTGEAAADDVGDTIGTSTVGAGDLGFKADANGEFSASPVPEPGTLFLLGAGLLGLSGFARRKAA